MLTEFAYTTDLDSADVSPTDRMPAKTQSDSEIYSLYATDSDLPQKIRSNFKAVQAAKNQLVSELNTDWNEKTTENFVAFDTAILAHLRMVSVHMYVPVRKNLRVERTGSFERFKIFESKAAKTNELIALLLRKYYRSNQFFNIEHVQNVKTDMERVVGILSEQLNRERAFLFPLYLKLN